MGRDPYPSLDVGKETGIDPVRMRVTGRHVTVVGAVIDGGKAAFDNGILRGKSKVEEGITFGPEVLRAMNGRRVVALWMALVNDGEGNPGWFGLTVGEMRIDAAKKDGYRDVIAFQAKMSDASRGRVAVTQLKDDEKKALAALLREHPDLWTHAEKTFRETVTAAVPEMAEVGAGGAAGAADTGAPTVSVGAESGSPRSMRSFGRDVTVLGMILDGGKAAWDHGLLEAKARVQEGIAFGSEQLRALKGRRVCGIWVTVVRQEDGRPGWFGATVAEMRIDADKKEGFADLAARTLKLNDAARGRVELWRLKPEEREAVAGLLQAETGLWEAASENMVAAFD